MLSDSSSRVDKESDKNLLFLVLPFHPLYKSIKFGALFDELGAPWKFVLGSLGMENLKLMVSWRNGNAPLFLKCRRISV